jgi:ankyrin repeat protein
VWKLTGTAKRLSETKADINARDYFDQTPLLEAAENGHEVVVKLLLEAGADIDFNDGFGETPPIFTAEISRMMWSGYEAKGQY